jgi:uncharacterized protein involved in exopolysaccharide biosynthesis
MSLVAGLRQLLYEGVDMRLVWRRLWAVPRRTLGLIFGAGILAVAVSFVMPRWYQAGATLVVDTGQQMSLGGAAGMLGLAAQLGFGAGMGPTNPQFYEALLKSRSVQEHVTTAKFPLGKNGELLSLEQYWSHHEHPSAREHLGAVKRLGGHLQTSSNPRISQMSFKIEGPSKSVAKLMADTVLAALNDIVTEVRRKHASAEREFLDGRWHALGDSLRAREDALRRFYERNHNLASPELQFEDARLRREVDRVQVIYAQLGSQLEQARIQEVRDTPALTVVDSPIEPVRKSSPSGRMWGLTAAVLGAALALLIAMGEAAEVQLQALRLQPAAMRRTEQG